MSITKNDIFEAKERLSEIPIDDIVRTMSVSLKRKMRHIMAYVVLVVFSIAFLYFKYGMDAAPLGLYILLFMIPSLICTGVFIILQQTLDEIQFHNGVMVVVSFDQSTFFGTKYITSVEIFTKTHLKEYANDLKQELEKEP